MKNVCWTLILLGAISFLFGTLLAFSGRSFIIPPYGYWRGAMGFVAFAIALRLMDDRI